VPVEKNIIRYFYIEERQTKSVIITEKTANRMVAICDMPRRNSYKILEAAYYYACSEGETELTDERLNEFLDEQFK